MIIQELDSIVFYSEQEQVWKNSNDEYHRLHGPALIQPNGYQAWYFHDEFHREGGPAVIFPDGTKYWYLNRRSVT